MTSTSIQGQLKDIDLVECLGRQRMEPYLVATGYHARRALFLYRWNGEVSASFWQLISLAEVALRNSLDECIGTWCESNGGSRDWLLRPETMPNPLGKEFKGVTRTFLEHAEKAKGNRDNGGGIVIASPHPRAGQPLANGDVLAQITLGVWGEHFMPQSPRGGPDGTKEYLPDRTTYKRRLELWNNVVRPAFPDGTDPGELSFRLNRLKLFRNRIAHHEPVLNVDMERHRQELLTTVGEISPDIRDWYAGSDPIPGILARDPRQRRKSRR